MIQYPDSVWARFDLDLVLITNIKKAYLFLKTIFFNKKLVLFSVDHHKRTAFTRAQN